MLIFTRLNPFMRSSGIKWLSGVFLVLFYAGFLHAQPRTVSGRVYDAETGEPLAFVNIVVNNGLQGGATDIDGKFRIASGEGIEFLRLTYVGYQPLRYALEGKADGHRVFMKKIPYELREVVVYPGINPAHRIINNVIRNRDLNDPEKLLSFSYTSYEKAIFTLDLDSLRMIDTLLLDTSAREIRRVFDRQDIFIAESVTERKFLYPGRNYENVIATRVSGMKDPIFVFLVSQIQSTSFYRERITIGRSEYINPISKGSTSKYTFIIEDTAYTERKDTVFIISYRPRPNTNFDGLKGVLSVNSHKWAIQSVIAEPAIEEGPFNIRIQQLYELVNDDQWFPVQLNTDIRIRSIGATIDDKTYSFVGIGKSYVSDIELNPELVRRQFSNIEVDVDPAAHDRNEDFWNSYRVDSLSERDRNTYAFMDSIGREVNFDRLARTFETLMTGRIPYKFIDIDLNRISRYNQYEGVYLGMGIHTNDRLSRRFRTGGFFGYGFKDQTLKYGGDISAILHRNSELELKALYFYDVLESGGTELFDDHRPFLREDGIRKLLIRRMNITERAGISLGFRALRHFKWSVGFNADYKKAYPDYQYGNTEDGVSMLTDEFRFSEMRLGFRFAYREKFIRTRRVKISLGTKYPIVRFQYTRGMQGLLNGEFEYNRFDLKVTESFYTKYFGMTSIEIRAGYIDGDLPYCNLYNGNGSYRFFTLYAPGSFATMRMNEFLSNRYVALFFSHNFGKLLVRARYFAPEIVLATNIGFGDLNNHARHYNVAYNTMEKGYYESGVILHGLFNMRLFSLGLGAFYRYGPYGFNRPADNFAYKLSLVFPISDPGM
jgi:hypothetical protein